MEEKKQDKALMDLWHRLSERQKKMTPMVLIAGSLVLVGLLASSSDQKKDTWSSPGDQIITIDPEVLKKSFYAESQKEIQKRDDAIFLLEEKLKQIEASMQAIEKREAQETPEIPSQASPSVDSHQDLTKEESKPSAFSSIPIADSLIELPNRLSAPELSSDVFEEEFVEVVGGITRVSRDPESQADHESEKNNSLYLPPSFMQATLLNGFNAPTMQSGKDDPVLTILRVKDLAVLPNRLKQNLKGCFIIAEAIGRLRDERAHLRLITLSCLDHQENSVIDQAVKGYVSEGSKVGLSGNVVAKFGDNLAYSFLAGFFGGVGDGLKASSIQTTTTAFGPITQGPSSAESITKSGVGSGLAQASGELQSFYLDLARQAIPVIEVLNAKSVTVVITEGVELDVKNYDLSQKGGSL